MKKHLLLEKAMLDYPAGVKFETKVGKQISTGVFMTFKPYFNKTAHVDSVWRVDKDGHPSGMVYDGESCIWSEIIKDEPLKVEKVAVKVSTRQQAMAICKYKGWEYPKTAFIGKCDCVIYLDNEFHYNKLEDEQKYPSNGYTIIDFDFWAAQNGIETTMLIMVSEDGIEMFVGSKYCMLRKGMKDYYLLEHMDHSTGSNIFEFPSGYKHTLPFTEPENIKVFSTLEAANSFIDKMKPKDITLDSSDIIIKVFKKGFTAEAKSDTRRFAFDYDDLEKIYEAYKSLQ